MAHDELPAIDPELLASVTGGAGDNSEQITMMLQTLLSSIKELAASRNNSGDSLGQMLPMLLMMRNRQQSAPMVAAPVAPPGDGWIKVT
jgi:hypothetical protein